MENETIASLGPINNALIIALCISLFAKYILKLICWIMNRRLSRDKNFEKKCLYLKQSHNQHQCLLHYGEEYLVRNLCNKKKCPAYKTSLYTFEDWKNAKPFRFFVLSGIENCSEFVSVILIIYNLLK